MNRNEFFYRYNDVITGRPLVFAILNQELKIPAFVGIVNHPDSID